jgi:hypothetical protein
MDTLTINTRLAVVIDEQLGEFEALGSAVAHVAQSSPSSKQRVILCNNLVVGLTARIEEALRETFMEYLRVVEDCDAEFADFKDALKKSSLEFAVVALKKYGSWDEAKRKTRDLHDLLSGRSVFKLAAETIVNNQGNMRSAEVTDIAKRLGLNKIWREIARDAWFAAQLGEDHLARLEGMVILKWNSIFDERDNVVHRVSQANGWSASVIIDHIEFSKQVVRSIGYVVTKDCTDWHDSLTAV